MITRIASAFLFGPRCGGDRTGHANSRVAAVGHRSLAPPCTGGRLLGHLDAARSPKSKGAPHLSQSASRTAQRAGNPLNRARWTRRRQGLSLLDLTGLPAPTAWGAGTMSPTAAPAAWGLPPARRRSMTCRRGPCGSPCPRAPDWGQSHSEAAAGRLAPRCARLLFGARLSPSPCAPMACPPRTDWRCQTVRGPVAVAPLSLPSESVPFSATVALDSHAASCRPYGANDTRSLRAAALYRQLATCLLSRAFAASRRRTQKTRR